MSGLLDGIRVLDLSRVMAGPHAAKMLADMGADVIKVEPPEGDLTRRTFPKVGSIATYFAQQNTGKLNVSIDATQPDGAELVARLAEKCDVLIENFRTGVMEQLGLAYEQLSARQPRLIYLSISGYGSSGVWATRRAYAPVIQAETGYLLSQGTDPVKVRNPINSHADVYAGIEAASAILGALYYRERTGRGQRIEVSLAEVMLYVNEHIHDDLFEGVVAPGKVRSFRPGEYPVVSVADGTAAVIAGHPAEDGTFEMYCRAMGAPEMPDDPRFATQESRRTNIDALHDAIGAWAMSLPGVATLERRLADHGLVGGALRTVSSLATTEWAVERGAFSQVPDRSGGTITLPSPPWRFSDVETGLHGEPRFRGEDNRAVLFGLLGLNAEEIGQLERTGVLSSRVPDSIARSETTS